MNGHDTEKLVAHAVAVDVSGTASVTGGGKQVACGVPMLESETGPVLCEGIDMGSIATMGGVADEDARLSLSGLFARQGFTGKAGQSITLHRPPADPSLVFLGCGTRDTVRLEDLRRASAALVRSAGRSGVAQMVLPASLAELVGRGGDRKSSFRAAAQAVAEGAVLGAYRFSSHKSEDQPSTVGIVVIDGIGIARADLEAGARRGSRVAKAVCAARDMVNEPPSSMTPERVAETAREMVSSSGATTFEAWELARIESERLGGLLGVARGSAQEPRLVQVRYEPEDPIEVDGHVPHVVLVGKGITFDSGGLSLKTADGMATMKTDMSGAATVLASVSACADLVVRVRVTAIAPLTENMPGGRATKPGDVLVTRDGQTIEVLNTDAEGRLVLADALSLAAELEPDAIIDFATLTGAAVVSLGSSIAGLFGNDDALVGRVQAAATRAGEPMWRLPLAAQYNSHIESDVADMKNIGKPSEAGAIVAALLLERFVGEIPWVHIDMAGPARSDQDEGPLTKGGTGFGVRTLLEMLRSFSQEP